MKRTVERQDRIRRGFTILEVIIAVGILLGALTAIVQIMSTGTQAAVQGQFRGEAVMLAETKLNEALAGIHPLQTSSAADIEEAPDWTWEMSVEPASLTDLLTVTVTVERVAEDPAGEHVYSLARMVRDPQIFLDAALGEKSQ